MTQKIEKIVVATHNKGKLKEISALLLPFDVIAISAGEMGVDEPEETEATFIGNALLKARHSAKATNLPALADDSGLEVLGLNGAPGIYSARWAGENKDFNVAMARVEKELKEKNTQDYGARFVCALALVWPDGTQKAFEGYVEGHLEFPARGENGFGYDPIFVPNGFDITFGEMDADKKHAMRHRANAFKQLIAEVFEK